MPGVHRSEQHAGQPVDHQDGQREQIELLKRLLNSELKTVAKRNLLAERRFSEMLERAMRSYTDRSLDAAQVIAELVELAKQMRAERDRGAKLGLRDDELAFYDAVCQNDSAVLELGDITLKKIAHELLPSCGAARPWTGTRRSRCGHRYAGIFVGC